ncbi:MAG TPA: sugar ABC transporter permease [Firmicutes bacterium]|nr:sugar ABC transporter permease [Bacillota bacterium]
MKTKRLRLTARRREALVGLFFMTPFLIGTLVCFAFPTISSFLLSFGSTDSQAAGFHIQITGLENYSRAFFTDTSFVPYLLDSIQDMLVKTPLILVFSLLIAILLHKAARFKGFFRVAALLPFLLGNGQVLRQMMREGVDTQILSLADGKLISPEILAYFGQDFFTAIDSLFGIIVTVLWSCGVQVLLFLAAIQSISPALYESAHIDGANEYEAFWKITLPMVLPVLLLNAVYTIINAFTDSTNPLLDYIKTWAVTKADHGFAAAMGWTYFLFILLFIGLVVLVIRQGIRKTQGVGK